MSKLMIQTFFPTTYRWIVHQASIGDYILNELLFPDHIAMDQCPEVMIEIPVNAVMAKTSPSSSSSIIRIRQPWLVICATLGIIVSIVAIYGLLQEYVVTRPQSGRTMTATRRRNIQLILWMIAFGSFGMMNVSALPLHCFLEGPPTSTTLDETSSDYPTTSPILWMIDTYMTGLSSICLYLAALDAVVGLVIEHTTEMETSSSSKQQQTSTHSSRNSTTAAATTNVVMSAITIICKIIQQNFRTLWNIGWFIQGIGIACVVDFTTTTTTAATSSSSSWSSLGLELWYLLTPPIAGIPIVFMMVLSSSSCFGKIISRHDYNRDEDDGNENTNKKEEDDEKESKRKNERNNLPNSSSSSSINNSTITTIIGNGRVVFGIGAIIALLGVLVDRFVCGDQLWYNIRTWDFFGATTSVFFGCDLCFLGIYMVLMEQTR